MAVNPDTVREKNVRITPTPKDKGVQVVITIKKMDNGGIYINCGGPDERPLPRTRRLPDDRTSRQRHCIRSQHRREELLKASAKR
jgi:hypothetical protein